MAENNHLKPEQFDELVKRLADSYKSDDRTQHLDSTFLPSRAKTVSIVECLRCLMFPGFFDDRRLSSESISYHIGEKLLRLRGLLFEQVRQSIRYEENRIGGPGAGDDCPHCDEKAAEITDIFLERVPELRRLLALDVQAARDGDPAAVSTDEAIFCYPGIDAIFIHRVAHELYNLQVPLLPRMMSEYAHNETGIDIHPGAKIGESFFIDHGTGVVIGETAEIGNHVQIYQGVTLGALSPKNAEVQRGAKRHPTIEDNVTIYPNATILGGETVVGKGSTVNGSVFLATSVPPGHTVRIRHPQPELRAKTNEGSETSFDAAI